MAQSDKQPNLRSHHYSYTRLHI